MKLVTYATPQGSHLGVLAGEHILPLPGAMLEFIQSGPQRWEAAQADLSEGRLPFFSAESARLLAPLPNPGKVVGIGLNYMDHCREQKVAVPDRPIVFTKFNTAIIGPEEVITWSRSVTNQVDFEVELGVVIGQSARCVPLEKALQYVFGYTVVNDVSARDLQFSDRQWVRAKSLDTFCPIGPVIVTADEIPDPQALRLACRLNGQTMQDSTTAEMIFGVAELISRLSHSFTLLPGDIIATGTPDGVGMFRKPQVFMQDGDVVETEVEGIGVLRNLVSAHD
ncbi:MAG: fumarylacetoacetate hydrolase family protein [Anaerolineaceae bacterium]|nr:fumarylacetoacetate hydrolase family protein [Anaerolineaceae bacterium]